MHKFTGCDTGNLMEKLKATGYARPVAFNHTQRRPLRSNFSRLFSVYVASSGFWRRHLAVSFQQSALSLLLSALYPLSRRLTPKHFDEEDIHRAGSIRGTQFAAHVFDVFADSFGADRQL